MANTNFTPVVGALTGTGIQGSFLPAGGARTPTAASLTLTGARTEAFPILSDLRFSHLNSRRYGRYGHLIGFPKGRKLITGISVNPPSIAGNGGTGYVDVEITGVQRSRRYRVVMLPPSTLDAGLEVTTTMILDTDLVRVSFRNKTETAINDSARDWTAHVFSMVP